MKQTIVLPYSVSLIELHGEVNNFIKEVPRLFFVMFNIVITINCSPKNWLLDHSQHEDNTDTGRVWTLSCS